MHDGSFTRNPPLGRRKQRQAWTRSELLLAGRRLFSIHGLYESRVEDLTRTAGIAKGTLYLYFRDKEDLIQAVVAEGFSLLQQRLRERMSGSRGLDETVARIVAAHLDFFADNPDLLRIFHQARGMLKFDRPRWRPLRAPLQQHLGYVAELLGRTPSLARCTHEDRLALAIHLFGSVSGVASVRVAMDPRARANVEAEAVTRALVASCRWQVKQRAALGRERSPTVWQRPRRSKLLKPGLRHAILG